MKLCRLHTCECVRLSLSLCMRVCVPGGITRHLQCLRAACNVSFYVVVGSRQRGSTSICDSNDDTSSTWRSVWVCTHFCIVCVCVCSYSYSWTHENENETIALSATCLCYFSFFIIFVIVVAIDKKKQQQRRIFVHHSFVSASRLLWVKRLDQKNKQIGEGGLSTNYALYLMLYGLQSGMKL